MSTILICTCRWYIKTYSKLSIKEVCTFNFLKMVNAFIQHKNIFKIRSTCKIWARLSPHSLKQSNKYFTRYLLANFVRMYHVS